MNRNKGVAVYGYDLRKAVVDDFFDEPNSVRRYALESQFFKPNGETIWRTRRKLIDPGVKRRLEACWGCPISTQGWNNSFNGTFFVACERGRYKATPFVHLDTPTSYVTALVFLTRRQSQRLGTTFYRHRATGLFGMPNSLTLRHLNMTLMDFEQTIWQDRNKARSWEVVDRISHGYNRAVLFRAGLFHSASGLFGSSLETGRLWQSFHFELDSSDRSEPTRIKGLLHQ